MSLKLKLDVAQRAAARASAVCAGPPFLGGVCRAAWGFVSLSTGSNWAPVPRRAVQVAARGTRLANTPFA